MDTYNIYMAKKRFIRSYSGTKCPNWRSYFLNPWQKFQNLLLQFFSKLSFLLQRKDKIFESFLFSRDFQFVGRKYWRRRRELGYEGRPFAPEKYPLCYVTSHPLWKERDYWLYSNPVCVWLTIHKNQFIIGLHDGSNNKSVLLQTRAKKGKSKHATLMEGLANQESS